MFPPKLQGVLLGLSNTAGVLAGVFGTAATGYILQKGKKLKKNVKSTVVSSSDTLKAVSFLYFKQGKYYLVVIIRSKIHLTIAKYRHLVFINLFKFFLCFIHFHSKKDGLFISLLTFRFLGQCV